MLPRSLFTPELESFRASLARWLREEAVPQQERWEAQGHVDRAVWHRAGELGFLCTQIPEAHGGAGAGRLSSAIVLEEVARAGCSSLGGFSVHSDIVAVYLQKFAPPALRDAWLPEMARGEAIGAIAMTEPSTGSDLQAIRTVARPQGEGYVLSGAKTFITNGWHCDFALVAAKLAGEDGQLPADAGAKNITLFLVPATSPGFRKGQPLKKLGMKAQDTGELFFDEVFVPRENVVGGPNAGFMILMQELAWERLMIAIACVAGAEAVLAETLKYTRERQVFGKPVAAFQHSRFKLAEMKSEIAIGRTFVDRCLELELEKKCPVDAAAAAKYWTSEMLGRVVDQCVQLHGGYGYILDYPVARAYADARVQRIYGGTTEVMKEIIARGL
jgi:alkylation response protein AidB-like acyl-CoA dehydrogenase